MQSRLGKHCASLQPSNRFTARTELRCLFSGMVRNEAEGWLGVRRPNLRPHCVILTYRTGRSSVNVSEGSMSNRLVRRAPTIVHAGVGTLLRLIILYMHRQAARLRALRRHNRLFLNGFGSFRPLADLKGAAEHWFRYSCDSHRTSCRVRGMASAWHVSCCATER